MPVVSVKFDELGPTLFSEPLVGGVPAASRSWNAMTLPAVSAINSGEFAKSCQHLRHSLARRQVVVKALLVPAPASTF